MPQPPSVGVKSTIDYDIAMKNSTFAALFLFLAFALFSQEGPWFRDIKVPIACTEAQMTEFTAQLRQALLNKQPLKELLKKCPLDDNVPRVLYITLGDGLFPARTYYAAGTSFQNALSNLIEIITKREPEYASAIQADLEAQIALAREEKRLLPEYVKTKLQAPNVWNSLRFDVVQAVLPIDDYVVNSSRLLLSSIVGIAFDQTAAFAFPPEQLTGRYLMTAERQLSVGRIGNLISEANLWSSLGLWLQMGAVSTPFKVTLFETDSYFADENGAMRLFRA
ncbi:MAG: hypothetical protein MJ106_07075, partial [Lentisphaeria bacterium]|nr:hypothetical protein [Lentisphaeria bacterium]